MNKFYRVIMIIAIAALAVGLRVYAADRLQIDYDEPVYTAVGIEYANYLREGRPKMLAWSETVFEHPSLYKIFYGFAMLTSPPVASFDQLPMPGDQQSVSEAVIAPWVMKGRYLSIFFGSLVVVFLALVNPLAAFFLSISTLGIKYTSEVYLEALPMLTGLLSALTYLRWYEQVRRDSANLFRSSLWLALSAGFLGATAAGKYVFSLVGIAIIIHYGLALLEKQLPRKSLIYIAGWAVFSVMAFFILNPYLWPHPISRLLGTIQFHMKYRLSNRVQKYEYPFWQPLRWLSVYPFIYKIKPAVAIPLRLLDPAIYILAVAGLPQLFKRQRLFFYWLAIGLTFLLIWNTKWPQYTLIVLVPFTISAAEGILTITRFFFRKPGQA